jgi:Common central domain of tyrosinase
MLVRKSPRDMTSNDRSTFIDAVSAMKNELQPLPDGSTIGRYDQHVAIHLGVTGRFKAGQPMSFRDLDGGHNGPGFLPWHREYLLRIENELTDNNGNSLAIPYWDWMDQKTAFEIIFKDDFLGTYDNSGRMIVDQARFAAGDKWKLDQRVRMEMIIDLVFNPSATPPEWGEDLERNFRSPSSLPSSDTDSFLMERATYDDFRETVEAGALGHRRTHNFMHGWVGGVMGSHASPYDPIFVLNHAFIDRLWAL